MLRQKALWAATAMLSAAAALAEGPQTQPSADPGEQAAAVVDALIARDYPAATRDFDANLAAQLSPAGLAQAWEPVAGRVGQYKSRLVGRRWPQQANNVLYDLVYDVRRFEQSVIDFKVVFDSRGKVAGLFIEQYGPPEYANFDAFGDQPVTFGDTPWVMSASLSLPAAAGRHPGVIFLHGSGPQDREESLGPNKPFRDLAWGLASRGVAVLRYDKRTRAYPVEMAAARESLTVDGEVVDDAAAAVDFLKQHPRIDPDRVYLLGHSFGGTLAPRIAARRPDLAGLICLAAPSRPLEDAMLQQVSHMAAVDGTVSPEEDRQLSLLKTQIVRVKDPLLSPSTPATALPFGLPASYWLSLRGYDPAETARELRLPMLLLHSARDYQIVPQDIEGWKRRLSRRANVTFKVYADLNHLMIAGTGKPTPAEYQTPGHVAPAVVDDVAAWILHPAAGEAGEPQTRPEQ